MPQRQPWSSMEFVIPTSVMDRIGEAMVRELSRAAANEFARRKWSVRSRDGRSVITRSFSYKVIDGGRGLQLKSSFPGVENFATGFAVKRDEEGNIIIHNGPLNVGSVWVHPGVKKGNFLHVGLERGREEARKILVEEVKRQLLAGDPFK